ncbi:putative reverse transcriptase domain-containing protein [Tanacetum coccineum]
MDPYEEVAQQGQAHPLSPTYVPDPMELDEYVPVYVPESEHPEYHAPSDDDIQVEDQPYADDALLTAESPGYIVDSDSMEEDTEADSIDYPDEPKDGKEDDDEDPEEDPSEEHEPEDGDDDDNTDDEDKEPTEEEEEHLAPTDSSVVPVVDPVPSAGNQKAVRLESPMSASMEARIIEHAAAPIPPTNPTYDQAPLVSYAAGDLESFKGFLEHRMMTSIEEVNLRVSYQAHVRRKESEDFYTQLLDARTDRRDIRLEIDVVRGQRTAYETELHEVRQAYLSFEAQNRALLARLETLETHISRMEWQSPTTEDDAVRQIMRTQVLEARARIDTVEDAGSSLSVPTPILKCNLELQGNEGVVGLSSMLERWNQYSTLAVVPLKIKTLGHDAAYAMTWRTLKKKLTDKYCPNGEIKKLEIELWNLKVRGNDVATYTQRFQELALMCTKFLADETMKIDKYIGGLPDNIHGNVMSVRPKTLDFAIELANDLMDQKLRTYAERQNENKRKADDSSRNNHQQQPHKKQNGNVHPSVENARGMAMLPLIVGSIPTTTITTTTTTRIKRLGHAMNVVTPDISRRIAQNRRTVGITAGIAQGRAYALGGRDASPDSNVITDVVVPTDADVFLAHITTKEAKDKLEGKRLEDVPIVRDFPEVFPEDLSGIPSAPTSRVPN